MFEPFGVEFREVFDEKLERGRFDQLDRAWKLFIFIPPVTLQPKGFDMSVVNAFFKQLPRDPRVPERLCGTHETWLSLRYLKDLH